jgi:hypothetical protein
LFLLSLFFFTGAVNACTGYVIGFRGLNEAFDHRAFEEYALNTGYCSRSYSASQRASAERFIKTLEVPYHLYGYSLGAATVGAVIRGGRVQMPQYILTVGAYKTTDVNFDRYGVLYNNYFDASGRGQRSRGIFLEVSHSKIQSEVNKFFYKKEYDMKVAKP